MLDMYDEYVFSKRMAICDGIVDSVVILLFRRTACSDEPADFDSTWNLALLREGLLYVEVTGSGEGVLDGTSCGIDACSGGHRYWGYVGAGSPGRGLVGQML